MKRQRQSIYLPNFSLLGKGFQLNLDSSDKIYLTSSKDNTEPDQDNKKALFFELANIGLGSAKDITIDWEIDIAGFLKIIKKYDVYEKTEIEQGFLLMFNNDNKSKLNSSGHNVQLQSKTEIAYIPPLNIQPKPFKVYIPPVYEELYLHYLYYAMYLRGKDDNSKTAKSIDLDDPIPLIFSITYKNLNDSSKVLNIKYFRICIPFDLNRMKIINLCLAT